MGIIFFFRMFDYIDNFTSAEFQNAPEIIKQHIEKIKLKEREYNSTLSNLGQNEHITIISQETIMQTQKGDGSPNQRIKNSTLESSINGDSPLERDNNTRLQNGNQQNTTSEMNDTLDQINN